MQQTVVDLIRFSVAELRLEKTVRKSRCNYRIFVDRARNTYDFAKLKLIMFSLIKMLNNHEIKCYNRADKILPTTNQKEKLLGNSSLKFYKY